VVSKPYRTQRAVVMLIDIFKYLAYNYISRMDERLSKNCLKIPKWQSESVYRRRTYNTMAKRKSTKGQITIHKTYI
jgi:hypothetical protein